MTKRSLARLAPGLLLPALIAVASPGYSGVVASTGSSTHILKRTISTSHSLASLRALAVSRARSAAGTAGAGLGADAATSKISQVNRSLSRRLTQLGGSASRMAATAQALTVPHVTPSPVGAGAFSNSFNGVNDFQNRYVSGGGNQYTTTPPDQGLCVSPSFVFESVNDSVQVFSKAGVPLTPPTSSTSFYGLPPEINRTTGVAGPWSPTDPNCYYDPSVQRWFNVVNMLGQNPDGSLTLKNSLDIAVSKTSDPTAGWYFYMFPVQDDGTDGTPSHKDCPCIGDFPHIGMDANGFYIDTNEYPWVGTTTGVYGNDYNGVQLYGFSKKALVAEQSVIQGFAMNVGSASDGTPSFTMWPDLVPGTNWDTRNNGEQWFLQSSATLETLNQLGLNNKLVVWRLSNTADLNGDPTEVVLMNRVLGSETYGVPPQSEQKYGPVPLRDCLIVECLSGLGPSKTEVESAIDSSDSRMQTDWLTNNKLYGALDTIADINGRYQAAVAWFVVNAADTMSTISMANQGYIGVNGNITYPTIATSPGGVGAMGVTLVGANYYPTAAYIPVAAAGPSPTVGIIAPGLGPDDEFCGYLFFNCQNTPTPAIRPRWGDYGAAAFDGSSVWVANEYIGQRCTIDQYMADPTCGGTRAVLGNWYTRITNVGP